MIDAALAQVDRGFAVFALGHNTKIPVTEHGFKNATRNPDWVRTQLSAPSAGNYGMIWPTDSDRVVVAFDLDNGDGATESWEGRLQRLMDRLGWLPATKATTTPSGGRHAFFTWPSDVPVPPGDELFGFTVRWPGRGYLVGPGSSIDGREYQAGATDEIAELPRAWVEAAIAERRRSQVDAGVITITGAYELPEVIPSGRRYATVRDYVASRYNSGLKKAELWALVVSEVAPRFADPKPELELRRDFERVMAKITARLGPPAKAVRPEDAIAAVSPIQVVPLSEIATEAVEWLWFRFLPIGSITLFDGNPGEGKSTIVADLVARVTTGRDWPDGSTLDGPGTVLYVTKEDDPARQVRPRIEAAGGDVSRVMFVSADLLFPRDAARFKELLEQVRPTLVLLDPLMSYLEGKVKAISDNEVRSAIMTPLSEIAREMRCAMLIIRHFNKASGQSALNKGAGSLGGLAGAARMVLAIARDSDDDDERARVFGAIKSNYEAKPPSWKVLIESAQVAGFQMTVSHAVWQDKSQTSVADLMERSREQQQQVSAAEQALHEILKGSKEPMASKDALDAMKRQGYSRSVIYDAAKQLRVHVERTGFPAKTTWALPVISVILEDSTTGDSSSRPPKITTEDDWQGDTDASSRPQSSQSSEASTTGPSRTRARAHAQEARSQQTTDDDGGNSQSSQSSGSGGLPAGAPTREGRCPVCSRMVELDTIGRTRPHYPGEQLYEAKWGTNPCSGSAAQPVPGSAA